MSWFLKNKPKDRVEKLLHRFLKKTPHSESSVMVTLRSFAHKLYLKNQMERDMAYEALALLWRRYWNELISRTWLSAKPRTVLAYRQALKTYTYRVLEAKKGAPFALSPLPSECRPFPSGNPDFPTRREAPTFPPEGTQTPPKTLSSAT